MKRQKCGNQGLSTIIPTTTLGCKNKGYKGNHEGAHSVEAVQRRPISVVTKDSNSSVTHQQRASRREVKKHRREQGFNRLCLLIKSGYFSLVVNPINGCGSGEKRNGSVHLIHTNLVRCVEHNNPNQSSRELTSDLDPVRSLPGEAKSIDLSFVNPLKLYGSKRRRSRNGAQNSVSIKRPTPRLNV